MLSSEKQTPALGVVTFRFFRPYLHKSFTGKRQLLVGHFLEWERSRKVVSPWYKPIVQQAEVESCCCSSKLEYVWNFAPKYTWQFEIWKCFIRHWGTVVLGKAWRSGISRKFPETALCVFKTEQSTGPCMFLRDARCWRTTVIWFWRFSAYWRRPGWLPALTRCSCIVLLCKTGPGCLGTGRLWALGFGWVVLFLQLTDLQPVLIMPEPVALTDAP